MTAQMDACIVLIYRTSNVVLVVFFRIFYFFFTFCIFGFYTFISAVSVSFCCFVVASSVGLCLSGNREINMMMIMIAYRYNRPTFRVAVLSSNEVDLLRYST